MIDTKKQRELVQMSMTPTEFAVQVGSDGKTVRKFLRSITPKEDQPGKGSRWALEDGKAKVTKLTKQFRTWEAAEKQARAERAAKAAAEAATLADEDDEELVLDDA